MKYIMNSLLFRRHSSNRNRLVPFSSLREDSGRCSSRQRQRNEHSASVTSYLAGTSRSTHLSDLCHEQQQKRYLTEHFAYIRDIFEKNLAYLPVAQRNGWAGKVIVFYNVQNDGRVKDIKTIKSSGHTILDENVIETIGKVQPFPRPPVPAGLKIILSFGLE
ncbi:MAG: energy transducer TonB [Anaerolineales bacterium]|nr:energy transducer TonB [Anaerolineales bacterium]